MSLTIGGITFDHVVYDQEADVLYLHAPLAPGLNQPGVAPGPEGSAKPSAPL